MNKIDILGVGIDPVSMTEAIERVEAYAGEKKNVLVATANAEMIMRAARDPELKVILNEAALVVPDGHGTVWAARHLGYDLRERVAGYDLAQNLMHRSPKTGYKFFFFGSAPGVAKKAKAKAESLYPGIQVVGVRDGYFSAVDEPQIVKDIRRAQPDILLVALGVPKQEKWIKAHLAELEVPVAIGVGGTLDVMAGVMKRAPHWVQSLRLEWLFRGMLQPKRVGRLMALPKFVWRVHRSRG